MLKQFTSPAAVRIVSRVAATALVPTAAINLPLRKLKTSSLPWFGLAGLSFVLGVFVLAGGAQEVALLVALFVFLGACLRGLVLAVRDDDVSSASIRDPEARTLGIVGSDSAAARRRRRDERARQRDSSR